MSGGFSGKKCGAKTRRGGECHQPAMENGRCRFHGGYSLKGTDHPSFKHGRYSKSLPDRLVSRYEEALADEDRHDLRDEISVAETKLDDLFSTLDQGGGSDSHWLQLEELERKMRNAQTDEHAQAFLRQILRIIQFGADEARAWTDIDRWLARKQRLVAEDIRVAQTKQEMVSAEEVMALMAGILDAIRRHVEDQPTRSALARDIRALGDPGGDVISFPGA